MWQAPRVGPSFLADIQCPEQTIQPIIEHILYDQAVLMLAGDPGTGKSLLAIQLALSVATQRPLFNHYAVQKPGLVYYCQFEGAYPETCDRLKQMTTENPLTEAESQNFAWHMLEGFNALKEENVKWLIKIIQDTGQPVVIILDPIYMAVTGGLQRDEIASQFVQFSNRLRGHFQCAVVLIHHTHRAKHDQKGQLIHEDDPFYGSVWIKAHVDASYLIRHTGQHGSRIVLEAKKSRAGNIEPRILLDYHPEQMLSEAVVDPKESDTLQRLLLYLKRCYDEKRPTDFYQCLEVSHTSVSHLRRLQNETAVTNLMTFVKKPGGKTLWLPKSMA